MEANCVHLKTIRIIVLLITEHFPRSRHQVGSSISLRPRSVISSQEYRCYIVWTFSVLRLVFIAGDGLGYGFGFKSHSFNWQFRLESESDSEQCENFCTALCSHWVWESESEPESGSVNKP